MLTYLRGVYQDDLQHITVQLIDERRPAIFVSTFLVVLLLFKYYQRSFMCLCFQLLNTESTEHPYLQIYRIHRVRHTIGITFNLMALVSF